MKNAIIFFLFTLSLFLFHDIGVVNAQERCRVETVGGVQVVSYSQYYMQMARFYQDYGTLSGESSNILNDFLLAKSKEVAIYWIDSCPQFYNMLENDVLPHQGEITGNRILDRVFSELGDRTIGSDIERLHSDIKNWLRTVRK